MKASVSPSSCTLVEGIRPSTILQNTQSLMVFSSRSGRQLQWLCQHASRVAGSAPALCARHLTLFARNLNQSSVLEAQRAKASAPYAAAVQRNEVGPQLQAKCGPVAADDRVVAAPPPPPRGPGGGERRRAGGVALSAGR